MAPGSDLHNTETRAALTFDPAAYAAYVKESDLTETQQRELLETLWVIIVSFVDLGFALHPVQQVAARTDQIPLADESDPMLRSDISSQANTKNSGARPHAHAGRREES